MLKILKTITTITVSLSLLSPITANNNIEYTSNVSIPTLQREVIQAVESYSNCYTQGLSTNEDLQTYATRFLKDNYNMDLNVNIQFVELDKDINGSYWYKKDSGESTRIDINSMMLNNVCEHEIERTLRHELTHLALNELGRGFEDGNTEFELENFNNGGRSNNGAKTNYLNTKIISSCCD